MKKHKRRTMLAGVWFFFSFLFFLFFFDFFSFFCPDFSGGFFFFFFIYSAAANIFTNTHPQTYSKNRWGFTNMNYEIKQLTTEKSKLLIWMKITSSPNLFERMVCMLKYAQWKQNKVKWIRSVSCKSPKWYEQKFSPINYNESMSMTPNTTQHNLETAIGFYDRSMALSHIKGFRLRSLTQQILT